MPRRRRFDRFVTRRQILTGAGAVGGAALLGGCGGSGGSGEALQGSDPVVIVGSGFGGSIAALRLAEAGIESVVFERGRRWEIRDDGDTFPMIGDPDRRASWLDEQFRLPVLPEPLVVEKYVGLIEVIDSIEASVSVLAAAGIGGGSLVYGGTLVQPTERAFYESFPTSVDYGVMSDVYYERARRMLSASDIPADILEHPNYDWTSVAVSEAEASGLPRLPATAGVDWDVVRAELRGDAPAAMTAGWYAISGCNSGAINSLDRNYLLRAEQSGRVEVRPQHAARFVEKTDRGYRVHVDRIDEQGNVLEVLEVDASRVFFAAGSMGTTRLLLRSRAEGGLDLPDEVGGTWATNGDHLMLRSNPAVSAALQGGPAFQLVSREDDSEISGLEYANGNVQGLMATLGMTVLDQHGSITFDDSSDDIALSWPQAAQDAVVDAVQGLHDALDAGTPGTEALQFGRANTYHPLGGAVMERVCDTYGRVIGQPGLYVVDGALVPGYAGARNPALTIAALAERALDDIVEKDF